MKRKLMLLISVSHSISANYIEDGLFRRRTSLGKSYIIFDGDIKYSNKDILKSDLNFTSYELLASGRLNTFKSASLGYRIFGMYTEGKLPYQMLYALPGNINLTAQSYYI